MPISHRSASSVEWFADRLNFQMAVRAALPFCSVRVRRFLPSAEFASRADTDRRGA